MKLTFLFCLTLFVGAAQISLLSDINVGTAGANPGTPAGMEELNGKFYFRASDGMTGTEVWEYDGVNLPSLSIDINPGSNSSNPGAMTKFNSNLYFSARVSGAGSVGTELYYYDGNGTAGLVADIRTGAANSLPKSMYVWNSKLYFSADDGSNGRELWIYDGINSPTFIDINPTGSSTPGLFTEFNGKLYFKANDGTGAELWSYDGVNPPSMVADIGASSITALIIFNNALYFHRSSGELWKYDGTNAPALVFDVGTGIGELTIQGNKLIFVGDDGLNGQELWQYDGSNPPTMIMDINPTGTSFVQYLTVLNDRLFFRASNGVNGIEPWEYDGTNPPYMIQDLYADGINSSSPAHFTNINGKLVFAATTPVTGRELYVWNSASLPVKLTDFSAKKVEYKIKLEWQTAFEEHNNGFEIQRSKNGINWQKIGFVQGQGNGLGTTHYSFWDENPYVINYYRLKQIDDDGGFEYSDIIQINNYAKPEIVLYPNPNSGTLNIDFSTLKNANQIVVSIYNTLGQLQVEQHIDNLDTNASFQVQGLKGFYLISIQDDEGMVLKNQKILFQ